MKIGVYLTVTVKEFHPLELAPEIRHAHRSTADVNGQKQYIRHQVWSPPIIMYIKPNSLHQQVYLIRKEIPELFEQVLEDQQKWEDWTIQYFKDKEEDFQTIILRHIGKYYRKHIAEHGILKTGLSLLWFEYLLLNKFTVPPASVGLLEQNLEAKRPKGAPKDIQVIPDTINRFLKAIILPMAMDAAKKITESLHDMLFRMAVTQKLSQGKTDLALCLAFILMIYLGRTEATLLLLCDSVPDEIGIEYGMEQARKRIWEMETSVSEYLTSLHKYTLSRRSSKCGGGPPVSDSPSAFEAHARDYGLVSQLQKNVEEDYGKIDASNLRLYADKVVASERPECLEVGEPDLVAFPYLNVRRLCWKIFQNVEHESD